MILGWTLETRRLLLLLPTDKYEEWSSDIPKMIAKKSSRGGKLRNTVDRLNHVGYIIPVARHFLGGNPSFEDGSDPSDQARRFERPPLVARSPRSIPSQNQPDHVDDQRGNNSLPRRRMQARDRGIQCFSRSSLALRAPSTLIEPRNSELPRVLRIYRWAMDRFTVRESPNILLDMVSDRRLDEQKHFTG
jgi:hypothetical protein